MTELIYDLRTEAHTPLLQALSVGTGVLIGCLPIYGLHLGVCIVVNRLFRLNLIKMYLATNINNPISAPFLVYCEIQVGSLVRQGKIYQHSLETARTLVLREFFLDILLGALVIGILFGAAAAIATFIAVRWVNRSPNMAELVDTTGRRYLKAGLLHWELARARLRFDPIYRTIVQSDVLPDRGSFLHVGCGRGLLMVFVDVASQRESQPLLKLNGVDRHPARVKIARQVLGNRARIELDEMNEYEYGVHDVVVNLDCFKSFDRRHREEVLRRTADSVRPSGVLIVRASTASAWTKWWPFRGLTESRIVCVLEELRAGFVTRELYRSLRKVVIVATRPDSKQT